ncbi:MAG: hypothetical protein ACRC30_10910 [Clostridium sp.]
MRKTLTKKIDKETWKILNKYGIFTDEEVVKAYKSLNWDIGIYTTILAEVKEAKGNVV